MLFGVSGLLLLLLRTHEGDPNQRICLTFFRTLISSRVFGQPRAAWGQVLSGDHLSTSLLPAGTDTTTLLLSIHRVHSVLHGVVC